MTSGFAEVGERPPPERVFAALAGFDLLGLGPEPEDSAEEAEAGVEALAMRAFAMGAAEIVLAVPPSHPASATQTPPFRSGCRRGIDAFR